MKKVLGLVALAAAISVIGDIGSAAPLESYRWKARPVIVFGSEQSGAFRQQLDIFNRASPGFRERDMVIVTVAERGGRQELRRAYNVAPGEFEVLLVGKDGGVKLRSRDVVSPQELFRLVDAMPMRRQEMRQR
jgi:hypothetical protein